MRTFILLLQTQPHDPCIKSQSDHLAQFCVIGMAIYIGYSDNDHNLLSFHYENDAACQVSGMRFGSQARALTEMYQCSTVNCPL